MAAVSDDIVLIEKWDIYGPL